jgi:hypothetical protein
VLSALPNVNSALLIITRTCTSIVAHMTLVRVAAINYRELSPCEVGRRSASTEWPRCLFLLMVVILGSKWGVGCVSWRDSFADGRSREQNVDVMGCDKCCQTTSGLFNMICVGEMI